MSMANEAEQVDAVEGQAVPPNGLSADDGGPAHSVDVSPADVEDLVDGGMPVRSSSLRIVRPLEDPVALPLLEQAEAVLGQGLMPGKPGVAQASGDSRGTGRPRSTSAGTLAPRFLDLVEDWEAFVERAAVAAATSTCASIRRAPLRAAATSGSSPLLSPEKLT